MAESPTAKKVSFGGEEVFEAPKEVPAKRELKEGDVIAGEQVSDESDLENEMEAVVDDSDDEEAAKKRKRQDDSDEEDVVHAKIKRAAGEDETSTAVREVSSSADTGDLVHSFKKKGNSSNLST